MGKHLAVIVMIVFMCVSAGYAQSADDLILMSEEFPPYNFEEGGKIQGTSVDLMEMILQKMNSKLTRKDIQLLPWARSYKTLQDTKNTALFAMTKTKNRENLFKWVGPITTARNVLIAKKDKHIKITSIDDVKKYKAGVVRDDAGEQLLVNAGIKKESLEIASEAIKNVRMLAADRIDLFAYDENVTKWLLKKEGSKTVKLEDFETVYVLEEGQHYFAFNKDTPDTLIQAMQKVLDELKAQGEYQKILDKYLR